MYTMYTYVYASDVTTVPKTQHLSEKVMSKDFNEDFNDQSAKSEL